MEISWEVWRFVENIQLKILEIPVEKSNRIKISGEKFPKIWVNKIG